MIKLKTEVLQNMLNKAFKLYNQALTRSLPIVGLVEIETNDKGITIKSTDKVTTFIVTHPIQGLAPARATVDIVTFTALVNKITTEDIELVINPNSLTIIGNGVYNLDISVDESGEVVKLPTIDQRLIDSANKEFDFKGVTDRLKICRPSIPETIDQPELCNYYMKDIVIGANGFKMGVIKNIDSMKDVELFIPKDFGRILIELDYIKANYVVEDNSLVIVGENFVLGTTMSDEFDKFPLDRILEAINQEFKYEVVVNKNVISGLLDRLSLFISDYDSGSIDLIFTPECLKVTNKKKTCDEDIEYVSKNITDLVEVSCIVNASYLKSQLDVLPSDQVVFKFGGSDTAMVVVDGEIIQLVALIEEE